MRKAIVFITCVCVLSNLFGQKLWTLKQCIEYAQQNNLEVKANKFQDTIAADNILTAKAAWLPSLSFSSGQNYSYTNHTNDGIYNASYGLNANMSLYDGGKIQNNIKEKNLQKEITAVGVTQSEHNIMLNILRTYIQILYAKEAITTAESNLQLSTKTLERAKELVKAGSMSNVDYAMLESEYADYNYRLTEAQNTYEKQKLQLKKLMYLHENIEIKEIPIDEDDILIPLNDVNTIYQKALTFVPDVLAANKDKELADLQVRTAQSGYYPNVSLSAGINTGHNSANDEQIMKQLKNSVYENVGLSISIPIYDKRQTRGSVMNAKNQVLIAENNIEDVEEDLLTTIEELHLDCLSYQNSYASAKANLDAAQKSYDLVEQQFELGMKNIIELLNQRTSLTSAQQNILQIKYQTLMKIKLLDYYQQKEIDL